MREVFDQPLGGVDGCGGPVPGAVAQQCRLAQAERGEYGSGYGGGVVERGEFGDPGGALSGGGLLGQPGLARAAGAGEGDQACAGQIGADGTEFGFASDEGGEPGADVALGGVRVVRSGRRYVVVRGMRYMLRGMRYGVFRGVSVLVEEFPVESGEFRSGIGAQAVGECPAGLLVRDERVGLSAFGAQRPEQLGVQGFVVRVGGRELPELGYESRPVPAPEVGLDALLDCGEPVGLRPYPLVPFAFGEVGEGGPAPEVQRGAQGVGGGLGVSVGQFPGALAGEPLEDVQVDVVGARVEPVAGGIPGDRRPAEGAAQPPTSAWRAAGASCGGSPPHTSSTSAATVTGRPARRASAARRARSRGPPTGSAPPSPSRASVTPRIRYRTEPLCPGRAAPGPAVCRGRNPVRGRGKAGNGGRHG